MEYKETPFDPALLAALLSDARYVVTDSQAKFVRFTLRGEIPVDEHRTAIIDREISIRVTQKGNLPRHRAKAAKGKKGFEPKKWKENE